MRDSAFRRCRYQRLLAAEQTTRFTGGSDYKETGMDDGEEEEIPEPEVQDAQEQLDSYAIPDEADQMGIPDAMRFEQAQRKKGQETQGQRQESGGQEEKGYEPSATSDKTNENSIENASIEISDIEKSEQPHNYVIDIHNQETGGERRAISGMWRQSEP